MALLPRTVANRPVRLVAKLLRTGIWRPPYLGGLVLAAVVGSAWFFPGGVSLHGDETRRAAPATSANHSKSAIHALARLEPEDGLIRLGATPGARIAKVLVQSGQMVKSGEPLVILEGAQAKEQQVLLAETQKSAVDFQRRMRQRQIELSRQQFDELQSARLPAQKRSVEILKQSLDVAQRDLELLIQGNIPETQVNSQRLLVNQTKLGLEEAQVKLRELEIADGLLSKQRSLEDEELSDSNPQYAVAERQLELARAELEMLTLRSPCDGQVFDVLAHAGEVSSGVILYMGNIARMVAVAEVYQTEVAGLRIGDPATVKILGQNVAGKVTRIDALVGRNALTSLNPMAPRDRRVVNVTILLDQAEPAARYVHMEVDVAILRSGVP